MSKLEYLKDEQKEKALEIIKIGIALKMSTADLLEQLKKYSFDLSERTVRRYKQEIFDNSGDTPLDVFQNHVSANLIEDILSFREIEKQCWKMFYDAKNKDEQFKALNMLRRTTSEKLGILKKYPRFTSGVNCRKPKENSRHK